MRYKKILFLCILLIVAVSAIGAVSSTFLSSEGITPFTKDTVVTIEGLKFTIPAGYGEDMSKHVDGTVEDGIVTYDRSYFNENADLIGITIIYPDNGNNVNLETFKEPGSIEKTIAGKHGYLEKSDSTDDLYFFTYVEDGKCILLSAPSQADFANIIS